METSVELDRQYEAAQAALLARHAPETLVRRVCWSQGETQVLELGAGPPLLVEIERFLKGGHAGPPLHGGGQ